MSTKTIEARLRRIYDIEKEIKLLSEERENLRLLVIEGGAGRITAGDMEADVSIAVRDVAKPMEDIYRIVKNDTLSCRLFRKVKYMRVSVRKR